MEIPEEIKKYIGLSNEEISILRGEASGLIKENMDGIIEDVISSLSQNERAVEIVKASGLSIERAKELFREWLNLTLEGNYDEEHASRVFKIGLAHCREGVPERLMVSTMGVFSREMIRVLLKSNKAELVVPLLKALYWNLALMLDSYEEARKRSLERATGIKGELQERLISISSKEIYDEYSEKRRG